MKNMKFSESINLALDSALKENKKLICFGLGINDPGRFFNTTKNLYEKYGKDRVFETPTSENAMTGMGIGLAINGYPCVMMHQRLDFFLLAMDQLVNNAAKWHFMFGGKKSVPITIRLIIGKGWGQGPTHSQSLQSWFAHIPGLKVVMPSLPSNAYSLLIESIKDPNPVIFLEHRWLHDVEEKSVNIKKSLIGKAELISKGKDLTIITYSLSTIEIMNLKVLINKNNISYDHIDLLSIKPLDFKKIKKSILKTKKVFILDSISNPICSIGSEILSLISLDNDIKLSKKPVLLSLPDISSPTSFDYTKKYYISDKKILNAISLISGKKIIKNKKSGLHDIPNENFKGPF